MRGKIMKNKIIKISCMLIIGLLFQSCGGVNVSEGKIETASTADLTPQDYEPNCVSESLENMQATENTLFEETLGGVSRFYFPGLPRDTILLQPRSKLSLKFIARTYQIGENPMLNQGNLILQSTPNWGLNKGNVVASIKSCARNFEDLNDGCSTTQDDAISKNLKWSIAKTTPNGFCKLIPGKTYFLNIKFSSCNSSAFCAFDFIPNH